MIFNRRISESKEITFYPPRDFLGKKKKGQGLQQVKIPGQNQDNLYDS